MTLTPGTFLLQLNVHKSGSGEFFDPCIELRDLLIEMHPRG